MNQHRDKYPIAKMTRWAGVSVSGYYDWLNRKPSRRSLDDDALLARIRGIYEATKHSYGATRITRKLREDPKEPLLVSRKRVARLMRENGLRAKARKKYKATTCSGHNLPVADNVLNRDFVAEHPGEKLVCDITYVATDEGWLYTAGVMDLCGRKIIGISMGYRMTKQLVIDALNDAIWRTPSTEGLYSAFRPR